MVFGGINIKVYHENTEFSITEKVAEPDYPLHWHNNFELEFILDGNGTQILNGREYPLCRGAFYILNQTDFHEVHSNKPLRLINIRFSDDMISDSMIGKILNYKDNIVFYTNGSEYDEIFSLLKILMREYSEKKEGYENVIADILECIFVFISRKIKYSSKYNFKNTGVIQKAVLYLHNHFRENPSLDDIAKIFAVNPNYFSTLFHKEIRMTYKQYMTMLRTRYAKKLILSTELTVTEICYACGFSSLPHFLRVFKTRFGTTPSQMRNRKKSL